MNAISVTLQSIQCHSTSEGSGDELFVVYQPDALFPRRIPGGSLKHHDIDDGQTWTLNQPITFTRDLMVTVYDQDPSKLPSLADYLFSVGYKNSSIPPSVTMANVNGANYTINMSVNV